MARVLGFSKDANPVASWESGVPWRVRSLLSHGGHQADECDIYTCCTGLFRDEALRDFDSHGWVVCHGGS
jgi:hypothetical protein